jgi:hypothetical protein
MMVKILACLISPHIYAFAALHGQEKDVKWVLIFSILCESLFAMNIALNFLTDFVPDGEITPERDLSIIANRYLHGEFLMDFIPTFPITFMFNMSHNSYWRVSYLIKIIRLTKGIKIYNVQLFMDHMKEINK